jgi:WhiB family transcriptional regulator, redox-sensing transcriptional regulator
VNYFEELAARLDRFEHVPDDVLLEIVTHDGSCMWLYANDLEPDWLGDDFTDRELAARICGGCAVRSACLEVELRTAGDQSLGVWGALPAEDIRALYPVWRARRQGGDRR